MCIASIAGEVCSNATRVFVQRGLVDEFTKRIVEEVKSNLVIGDPLKEETRVGATINEQHLKRVLDYVNSAKQEVLRKSDIALQMLQKVASSI